MPDRDATLDAFITPDTEPDEPSDADDAAATDADVDADEPADDVDEPDADADPSSEGELTTVDEPESDVDESGGEVEAEPVTERAETTFAWSPDGVPCPLCGAETRRRWRTDGGFVCHDCVDWERAPER